MRYALALLIGAAACSGTRSETARHAADSGGYPPPDTVEFRGVYAAGWEMESFQPCGSTERWWVADAGPLARRYTELATRPYEQVYAVVTGDTSPRGRVGHLGLYQRYVRIHEVVSIAALENQQHGSVPACP